MECPLDDNCLQLISDLPIEIVKLIVSKLGIGCEVEQTLIRGIHVAPVLKPVELPKNVLIEEFILGLCQTEAKVQIPLILILSLTMKRKTKIEINISYLFGK